MAQQIIPIIQSFLDEQPPPKWRIFGTSYADEYAKTYQHVDRLNDELTSTLVHLNVHNVRTHWIDTFDNSLTIAIDEESPTDWTPTDHQLQHLLNVLGFTKLYILSRGATRTYCP